MPDIQDMIGKEVELVANGVEYRGVLVEISEESVFLKMVLQWIELPAHSVSSIRLVGSTERQPEVEAFGQESD